MTNEYIVDFSTAKMTRLSRESFAVGALARFNNNHEKSISNLSQMLVRAYDSCIFSGILKYDSAQNASDARR